MCVTSCCLLHAQHRTTPIMGWSSWNTYHVNISDSLIKKQTDTMVALGLDKLGYTYINIDDGFFGHRDSCGNMIPHPTRFPNGMKPIADYIHSKGLKAGIYSDAGYVTCGSIYDNDHNGIGAGLYGHEQQDAQLYFNKWGFDFIKIDYCGAGTELDLEEQERYSTICKAIDDTGRNDVEINICRWAFPGTWAANLAASWRISSDIRPKWNSVRNIIAKNMPLSAYCRGGHFNDMDMLEISRGLKENEERVHFGMWCMMSSPLLIGCDLSKIRPSSLTLLKNQELIAINQDSLALQAYPVVAHDSTYVLVKDIIARRGTTRAVALYNSANTERRISVALSDLELNGKTRLHNVFTHTDLKATSDSITATIPAHDILILKATAKHRIEPTRYEAEWAYLPLYNDLGKRKREILYSHDDKASCGMLVTRGGGFAANSIIWDNVWSDNGGSYTITLFIKPNKNRGIIAYVNGVAHKLHVDNSQQISFSTTLSKGNNKIELTHPTMWMPDIDKIELNKQ